MLPIHIILLAGIIIGIPLSFQLKEAPVGINVRHDRAEITYINNKFIYNVYFNISKYNRTVASFNVGVGTRIDLDRSLKMNFKAYKQVLSGNYRFAGISFGLNLCDAIDRNTFGLASMLTHGNVTKCPFKTAYYVIYNAVPDISKLPPNVPLGQWKVEATFTYNKTIKLAVGSWYGAVEEKISW